MFLMEDAGINKAIRILLLIVLIVVIAYFGKPFLVPVVFAMLLSMLLLPLSERLIKAGWNKVLAIILCVVLLITSIAIIVSLLTWQIADLTEKAPQIEQNITAAISSIKQKLTTKFGLPSDFAEKPTNNSEVTGAFSQVVASIGNFLVQFVLVLVYIFLFLYYKNDLKAFVLKLVPKDEKQNARVIIEDSRQVAQKYLTGLALMIASLWVLYSIGFSIVGIENPIFFAMLCGTLEIIPFVGNLVGSITTAGFALAQGQGISLAIGVLITYGIVQFFQTYVLEPLVVGRGVNVNPLFTIAGLVAGEFIWGIPGIVLAIPVMGITKIIFDHIEVMKPYGELIGNHKSKDISKKLKDWWNKRKSN